MFKPAAGVSVFAVLYVIAQAAERATEFVIDGLSFPTLEVGFAWSDPEAAIADAKAHIDRIRQRYMTARPAPSAETRT